MSELAEQLLQLHASRPNQIFYGVDVLGSMFRDADIARLDSAYMELVKEQFMEASGAVVSYFGMPKSLYRVTQQGLNHASARPTAA